MTAPAGTRWPDVILVNGPSSAGKTTLSRALQAKIPRPYLVAGFDDFIFMSAPRYYRGADTGRQAARDGFTAEGVEMVTTSPPGAPPNVAAKFGPVFRRLVDSMAPAVRTLVDGDLLVRQHLESEDRHRAVNAHPAALDPLVGFAPRGKAEFAHAFGKADRFGRSHVYLLLR